MEIERRPGKGITIAVLTLILLFNMYLLRSKEITLDLEGEIITLTTRRVKVDQLLRDQGISWGPQDYLWPKPETFLKRGVRIIWRKAVPMEITEGDRTVTLVHHTLHIPTLLELAQIELGPKDRLEGSYDKNNLPLRFEVIRVQEYIEEVEEAVPFKQQRVLDPALPKGVTEVRQKGEQGLLKKQYLVRLENGVEKARVLNATTVVKEVKAEIKALGTKGTVIASARSLASPHNARQFLKMEATAYTHTGNRTFTGVYPQVGTIAVDPRVISLGTRLWVEGYGYGIAQDTGGRIKGSIIDLFMDTRQEALRWGRRQVNVYILD